MKEYKVEGHESSLVPKGFDWKLSFSDEFDTGELDTSKWSFRRHLFHKEHPGWIEDEGIEFDGSNIIFKLIEKDGKFFSSQLQTGENWYDRPGAKEGWSVAKFSKPKHLHRFGYYEVRCKLQKGDNWWSAFWLQSPTIGTDINEKKAGVEVDILESFFGETYIPHFIHWGGYGADYNFDTTLEEHRKAAYGDIIPVDDGFHRFGCMWDSEGYTFYVDGKQSGRKLTAAVSHTDTFILLGTEVIGYRGSIPGVHKLATNIKTVKDDRFIVDYVRVFDKI